MLAGLLYGMIEASVTAFAGSTYTQIVGSRRHPRPHRDARTACSAAPPPRRCEHAAEHLTPHATTVAIIAATAAGVALVFVSRATRISSWRWWR